VRNDEQSYKDKALIIHGASLAHLEAMVNYKKKIPVLVPYDFYHLKTKIKELIWKDWWDYLFVDSGAFSVSQGNASVNIQPYITFLKKNLDKINHYASLDVVGDGEQSLKNWKVIRKSKLYPIPVFHDGEDFDILKEYADNCSYIGLGAVAYKSQKARQLFFDKVFSIYPNRKKVGFHGFGVMTPSLLKRYPWRSVDSSKISIVARSGAVFCPNHLGSAVSISNRSSLQNKHKSNLYPYIDSAYNEDMLKSKFKEYNLSYKIAKLPTPEGVMERIFFSLDFMDEYIKIPEEFNPDIRVNSLFD